MKHQTTRYGEIPFYKIGTFGNTADAFISKKLFLEYQTKYSFPKKGDILISASGTIGRAIIYDGKPAYFQDSNIVWIDNDETLVKNDFLFYAYSNVKWNTEHTTILRLYNDNFRNTLIPLPSLNEQIAIADILSALDRCLHALDSLIFKKESVKKALSFELLSQRKRLKGFNQAWQKVRLGDIFFITAGGDLSKPHYSNTKQSDFNYPIYSNAIEKKGLYGYSSFFIIKNKSITITSRGTIGVAFFRDYPYVPIGRLLVLQPKISNIDCRFYTEYINSKVKFNTEQTTIPQLTIPKVALCEIPLPPLNEQIAIANILSALNKEIASLKNKKRQFENIKKALNHDLMSAKIRVLKK
ncbi:hypothetical protein MM0360_08210 [Helicobacter pylori]